MDLTLTLRLRELLTTYKTLRDASGLTPQQRGQAFNTLIADTLGAWGHPARVGVRGVGGRDETDVAFTIGHNYILEAKWEADPLDVGPLVKLSDRLKTRPLGTRAIVLSVSGFNPNALEWIGWNSQLLLMTSAHLEALLCGLLSPEELLDLLYAETAAAGNRLVQLGDVLVPQYAETAAPEFKPAEDAPPPWPVVTSTAAGTTASTEFTGVWASAQHPSALNAAPRKRLLVTTNEGVVEFHPATGRTKWALHLPGTEDRAVRGDDGSLTVLCRGALVRWHPTTRDLELLAGGFGGYATLEAGRDGSLWVYSHVGTLTGGSVTVSRIGEHPGDEVRHDVPFPTGERAVHLGGGRHFLSGNGHSTLVDTGTSPSTSKAHWVDSVLPNPKAVTAPDEDTVLVASTRGSLDGSLHRLDLRQSQSWTELFTFTANRATDLTFQRTGARYEGWLLADVSGNTQLPTPVLVKLTIPAATPS